MENLDYHELRNNRRIFKGFGFLRRDIEIQDVLGSGEYETIKGVTLFAFGRGVFTCAYAPEGWVNKHNKFFRFGIEEGILFTKYLAFGLKGITSRK